MPTSISFAQFADGKTNIIQAGDLLLGFMTVEDKPDDELMVIETLYAISPDKRIKKTTIERHFARPNVNFSQPGWVWVDVDTVPANAEFIGNYANTDRIF